MEGSSSHITKIPLRTLNITKKKFNVAKFHTPLNQPVDFKKFAKPVKMYRAPNSVEQTATQQGQTEKKKAVQPASRFTKDNKVPWHVEDAQGNNCYDGTLEGGQTSNYVLFVYEESTNEFKVIPCGDWYNFKPKRTYQTLSIEEAEAQLTKRKKMGENVAAKMDKATVAAPGTAAPKAPPTDELNGERDKEDEEFVATTDDFDEDKFAAFGKSASDEESKPKPTKTRKTKKEFTGEEEGDADNEDADEEFEKEGDEEEPDWKGLFDDDEDEERAVEDLDDEKTEKDSKYTAEGEEDVALTEAGKEMRNLLKNHHDELSEGSDTMGSDSEDEDDDDFNLEEKLPDIINLTPFYSKLVAPSLTTTTTTSTADNNIEDSAAVTEKPPSTANTPPAVGAPTSGKEKKSTKKGKASSSKGKDKKKEELKTEEKAKQPKTKKEKKTPSTKTAGKKRTSEALSPSNSEKQQVSATSTPSGSASSAHPPAAKKAKTTTSGASVVSEDEVRKVLSHGRKMLTIEFIRHFEIALNQDPSLKNTFSTITKKLCAIVDEGGKKYIILKPEYR